MNARFLEPLDVLFLRGNKLFGDPGSYGEALIPPWPSVVAGALRSRMLVDAKIDLLAFARGEIPHPTLGTSKEPGTFTVTAFHLAQKTLNEKVEPLYAPPADLVLEAPTDEADEANPPPPDKADKPKPPPTVRALRPAPAPEGISCSYPLARLPILAQDERSKPTSGYWLTAAGFAAYLAGNLPNQPEHWRKSTDLWSFDARVGVGLETATGSAADGKLFSVQAIAFKPGVGFLVTLAGTEDAPVPATGSLRLGGDGRAVAVSAVQTTLPAPDYAAILQTRRCRLLLTTPGLFAQGWLPTGSRQEGKDFVFDLHGIRAKLVAAAVPRFEIVSGWDLAQWQPKPAERAAPTGSVYWLEDIEADEAALRRLTTEGLWQSPAENATRRAEGFNRCALAAWHEMEGA
jgi:CRISPR-associated protein Cmr3